MLPPRASPDKLANDFVEFFDQKIQNIRSSLDSATPSPSSVAVTDTCSASFDQFRDVSHEEIREVVKKAAKKSCMKLFVSSRA